MKIKAIFIVLFVQLSLGSCYLEGDVYKDSKVDGSDSIHHKNWMRHEIMDNNGLYWLQWWVNASDKDVHFEVTVNTRGYVGLGFSKDGRMSRSDMVLLWVDDSTGQTNALVS